MKSGWRLAWRNLRRNRRRNIAAVCAVMFGYTGLALLGGYAVRVDDFLRTNSIFFGRTGHVAFYKEGGLEGALAEPAKYALTPADQDAIMEALRESPEVVAVGRYLLGMGLAGNGCKAVPVISTGLELAVEDKIATHPEIVKHARELMQPVRGRALGSYQDVDGAAALATGLASLLGKTQVRDELGPPGPPGVLDCAASDVKARIAGDSNIQLAAISWSGSLSAVDAEVVSTFRAALAEAEYTALVTSLTTLQQLYDTDGVTYAAAYLTDYHDAHAVAERAARKLEGTAIRVYPYDHDVLGAYYIGTLRFVRAVVGFIGVIVVSVVAFAMFNATTLSVLERTREMGTLRALGYTRGQLRALYVREATLVAALACAAGLVVTLVTAGLINMSNVRFSPPGAAGTLQLMMTPTPLMCLCLAAIMTLASAVAAVLATRSSLRDSVVNLIAANRS